MLTEPGVASLTGFSNVGVCFVFGISMGVLLAFLESGLTPGFSRPSFNESKRTLVVPEKSFRAF